MLMSCLNEISGGRRNVCLVSESLRRILKLLIMTFLLQSFVGGRGEVEWNSFG